MHWNIDDTEEILFRESEFQGDDAYLQWRLGSGINWGLDRDTENQGGWRSIILRVDNSDDVKKFANGDIIENSENLSNEWERHIRVPSFYLPKADHKKDLAQARYFTALVDNQFFEWLKTDLTLQRAISGMSAHARVGNDVFRNKNRKSKKKSSKNKKRADRESQKEDAKIEDSTSGKPLPEKDKDHKPVVVGIIDYGIAFAHERFRSSETETRIEYLWAQDGGYVDGGEIDYGRELTKVDIDNLLRGGKPSPDTKDNSSNDEESPADEGQIYQRARTNYGLKNLAASVARSAAHGTHVMDIACGYDFRDRKPDPPVDLSKRPIICVQLPSIATADTSGNNLDAFALDGIRYILDRALDLVPKHSEDHLPVVINFSYGDVAGSHDGTSNLEAAIDELIGAYKPSLDVVIPSGNSHLGQLHARMSFRCSEKTHPEANEAEKSNDSGEPITERLYWRVLPDDRTASFMEIWLPQGLHSDNSQGRIKLFINPPGSSESKDDFIEDVGPRQVMQWKPDGEVLCEARYAEIGDPTNRGMFLIVLPPTRRIDGGTPVAPSGTWTLKLVRVCHQKDISEGKEPAILDVDAWIQRDDTPFGFPRRGRQSYFEDANYQRLDHAGRELENDNSGSIVRRAGSINAIATGHKTIVVGGYLRKEKRPAKYSAGGRIVGVHRFGPDVMAVSDDSVVRQGILAAGTRSGSVVALNGTSVAAPQWTRWIADRRSANERLGAGRLTADMQAQNIQRLNDGHEDEKSTSTIREGAGPVEFPPPRRGRYDDNQG